MLILSTKSQLKFAAENNNRFIDGLWGVTPAGFDQVMNVLVFDDRVRSFIPVAYMAMTHKNFELYRVGLGRLEQKVKEEGALNPN